MSYVKIRNGKVSQYPITATDVMNANPYWDFPRGIVTEKHFRDYGCFLVVEVPPPINDVVEEMLPVQTEAGWTQVWSDRPFTEEEVADNLQQAAVALKELAGKELDKHLAQVTAGYTIGAVASWDQQKAEADAFTRNPLSVTPLIDSLAASRGIDKEELVRRILVNSQGFAVMSGHLLGREQAIRDLIDAATTIKELRRIEAEELNVGWTPSEG